MLEALEPRLLLAAVTGTIYNDLDNDGVRDVGEPGLADVRVFVDLNLNLSFDEGTEPSALTASDGTYSITNLTPDNYIVRQVVPSGFQQTQPQPMTAGYAVAIANNNDTITNRDFGDFQLNVTNSSISNFVWLDANPNGVQDAGEHGIAGVTVRLFPAGSGVVLATTTTDLNGLYAFNNLAAGNYAVQFTAPTGYGFVTQDAGGDDATDSDVNINTGRTGTITLGNNENRTNVDAGLVANRIVVTLDYRFDTSNFFSSQARRDVLQLAANDLVSRLNDTLTGIVPGGSNTWTATVTNPTTGNATQINNLLVAQNEIILFVGARSLVGMNASGAPGTSSSSGTTNFQDTVKGRGQAGALLAQATDFGPFGGAISFNSGASWHFGTTTAGLDGNETDLYSAATHELGHVLGFGKAASFNRLISGGLFTGGAASAEYDGVGSPPLAPDLMHWVEGTTDGGLEAAMDPTLALGVRKAFRELDFAAMNDMGWQVSGLSDPANGSIGDSVFIDINANGTKGTNEPGIAGITVELYRDDNADQSFTANELVGTRVTDANGAYSFATLPAGNYRVLVQAGQNALTIFNATTVTTRDITLAASQNVATADFGYQLNVTIPIVVYEDRNSNGTRDAGEPPIGNVTASLLRDVNGDGMLDGMDVVVASGTTDINGQLNLKPDRPGATLLSITDFNGRLTSYSLIGNTTPRAFTIAPGVALPNTNYGYHTNLTPITAQITATDASAGEPANPGEFTITVDQAPTSARPIALQITGTATNGIDYDTINTFVNIPANQTSLKLPVTIIDDAFEDPMETVIITVVPNGGYNVGAMNTATITLTDDDIAPNLTLTVADGTANEVGNDPAVFTITRDGLTTKPITILFTLSGTATSGSDYTAIAQSVTIPIGQSSANVTITPINDTAIEPTETVILTITPSQTYKLPGNASASISILSDDLPVVTMTVSDNLAEENPLDTGKFTFTRTGPTTSDLTVNFTVAGTAVNGTDYTSIGSSVIIPAGSASAMVTITPVNDTAQEGVESVIVTVAANAAYTIGGTPSGTVVIEDDDVPRTSAVGDKVFHDLNGNGIQDAGEPGLANVLVEAFTTTNILAGSAITDDNGNYLISSLQARDYTLRVTPPAGFIVTKVDQGVNDTLDSDIFPATGTSAVFPLAQNQTDTTRDAGLYENGSIRGLKYNDRDADGVREAGEEALPGVTVFIDLNSNGTRDGNEAFAVTDAAGEYVFTDLAPGTYRVVEITPSGSIHVAPEFAATLSPANEVQTPAVASSASGSARFTLDEINRTLAFDIFFANPIGATTQLHIHRGAAGTNGSVVYDLEAIAGEADGFDSPVSGVIDLTNDLMGGVSVDTILADLAAGNLYVNLHTTSFPNGELRGQIVTQVGNVVVLSSGEQATERDFGNQLIAPEITVMVGAQNIQDGQAAPVNFGSLLVQSDDAVRTFTVLNTGTLPLTVTAPTIPDGFKLDPLNTYPTTLQPNQSGTFTVRMPATKVGTFSGDIIINTNDPDENPFNIPISGTVTDVIASATFTGSLGIFTVVEGDVSVVNNTAQLTETNDAAMATTLDLPDNAKSLSFDFTWINLGDDDRLVTTLTVGGETTTLHDVTGNNFIANQTRNTNPIDISHFAGAQDAVLEIRLMSVNGVNAQVRVDNVIIKAQPTIELVAQGKNKAEYIDSQGNFVTVSMSGDGSAIVRVPDVNGMAQGDAVSIELTGTTAKSSLTFSVKGNTGITRVDDITIDGPMSALKLDRVDLLGSLTTGPAKSIKLHDVKGGATINIDNTGAGAKDSVTLTFNVVEDLVLTSLLPIKSLTAVSWTDTDPTADKIIAPSLGKLTTKGDKKTNDLGAFEADLMLDGSDPNAKQTLGSATFAGPVTGLAAMITGPVGSLTFKSTLIDTTLTLDTGVKSIKGGKATNLTINGQGGDFGSLQFNTIEGGTISVDSIKSLTAKKDNKTSDPGDINNLVLALAGSSDPKVKDALGSLKADGGSTNLQATVGGSAGAIDLSKAAVDQLALDVADAIKSIKLGDVNVANITGGSTGAVQAVRWVDGTAVFDDLKSLKTTGNKKTSTPGDAGLDLTVNADGLSTSKSPFGGASIAGTLSGAWSSVGPVGSITAGAISAAFVGLFEGEVKSLASKAQFDGFAAAFAFGKVDVKTTMTGATIIAGSAGSGTNTIGTFKTGGDVTGGTRILVGVDPVNGVFDDGDDVFKTGDTNFIKSMTIGGDAAADSVFAAGAFPKTVSINKVKVDPLTDDRFTIN